MLAHELGVGFRDTDVDISALAGKSIPDIFVDEGEDHFRVLERQVVAEALKDPQLEHRRALVEVTDEVGPYIALNQPFHMSELPPRSTASSPALGQHTDEVLGALGYSKAEIAVLSGRSGAAKAAAE